MPDNKPFSVMRWINYNTADLKAFEKSSKYVLNPKSAPKAYQQGYKIDVSDPRRSMEIIEKRWKPRGNRSFKHGIFSFGIPALEAKQALAVTDEILKIYYQDYPILAAIHTDIPRRIHAHFLMGMTNVHTGKKFEQDQVEFNRFRDHYNKTLAQHGMLPLKKYNGDATYSCEDHIEERPDELMDLNFSYENSMCRRPNPYYHSTMKVNSPLQQSADFTLDNFFIQYRTDFYKFYTLGRGNF